MAYELIFTSAEKGVNPGTSGFCTVAYTKGLLTSTIKKLEAISTYKVPDTLRLKNAAGLSPPVVYSHYRLLLAGRNYHLVSRKALAGQDYTNRQNKIAHHLLFRSNEAPWRGPAWLAEQDGLFVNDWNNEPQIFSEEKILPERNSDESEAAGGRIEAEAWKELTGDAGWAGKIARLLITDIRKPVYLVFDPGMDMLKPISELVRLLPPDKRWQVTFNTYFTSLPQGIECILRCCLPDNKLLKSNAMRNKGRILHLASPGGEPDPEDYYVQLARGEQWRVENNKEKLGESSAGKPQNDDEGDKTAAGFVLMENRLKRKIRFTPDNSETGNNS